MKIDDLRRLSIHLVGKWGAKVDAVIIATTDFTKAIHCTCPSLALDCTTTAQYLMMPALKIKEMLFSDYVKENESRKKKLQDMLVSKYKKSLSSLDLIVQKDSSHDLEQCLLYFCMFPHDHLVRWNHLKMRYLAEGIAFDTYKIPYEAEHHDELCRPLKYLDDFVGQQEVQPAQVRKNGQVKRCQLPVMLLNHISGESKSNGFLALSCGWTDINGLDGDKNSGVRRLSIHAAQNGKLRLPNARKFHRLRTLVVFHTGGIANISELFKYNMLRVLDLKECAVLKNEHVKKICDLLLLRYLSLGDEIDRVPRDIAKLKLLETLAMRKTQIVHVPVELMELPELKHLLGMFQLYKGDITRRRRRQLLARKGKLQSLSGFVVGEDSREFAALMIRMTELRKVKIWYNAENWTEDVTAAIKNFIEKAHPFPFENGKKGSLSIVCTKCPQKFVDFIQGPGTLLSLKLCGDLTTFLGIQPEAPIIVNCNLTGIKELCLSETNLKGVEIVEVLKLFGALTYLKLVEKNLGELVVTAGCLTSLERLCLVAVEEPVQEPVEEPVSTLSGIQIQDGALLCLVSLHMLFTTSCVLPGIDITRLDCLEEIGLHSGVDQKTRIDWQKKASVHIKKPKVVFIPSPENSAA